jgi:sugar O-acyltransferase (sialic acid O-acetyltransferase NeuD family)
LDSLIIFGAGGLGREVLAMVKSIPDWNVIGFFDDNVRPGSLVNGVEVLGDRHALLQWPRSCQLVLAIGAPDLKKQVATFLLSSSKLSYPTLIHPDARILEPTRVSIGKGTILAAGSIITTDVRIGQHVLVNLNATIGHDSVIGNYSSIMPGANLAGSVEVGESVLIGSGANVLSEVKIGNGSVIGAGAVVNHPIGDNVTAVGVPARAIKRDV